MTKKGQDIDDPLARAAELGVIGGRPKRQAEPEPITPVQQVTRPVGAGETRVKKEKRKRESFFIYLPPELITRIKHLAVDRRLENSQLVEEAIREYLERHQS